MEYTNYLQATEQDKDLCTTIAMEELAELIQAISKAKRGKLDYENMAEEIADVFIVIDWLREVYSIKNSDIYKWVDHKEKRIVERLNNGEFK